MHARGAGPSSRVAGDTRSKGSVSQAGRSVDGRQVAEKRRRGRATRLLGLAGRSARGHEHRSATRQRGRAPASTTRAHASAGDGDDGVVDAEQARRSARPRRRRAGPEAPARSRRDGLGASRARVTCRALNRFMAASSPSRSDDTRRRRRPRSIGDVDAGPASARGRRSQHVVRAGLALGGLPTPIRTRTNSSGAGATGSTGARCGRPCPRRT